ncbi:SRPBCC domain-containing protein [Agrococcus versicolor]|uniref:SRPBCC domain-containing protein n=1 Tax=Agrococcus versicolor TaxID=501482 RepID=UPI0031CFBC76
MTRIVTVDASPDAVWTCITEPEHLAHWLGDIAAFPDGLVTGAQGRFAWTGEVVLAARVLDAVPAERLSFEWSEGVLGPTATQVTFALKPTEGGTLVHFEERGFRLDGSTSQVRASLRALAQGWTVELDELVAYAEARAA